MVTFTFDRTFRYDDITVELLFQLVLIVPSGAVSLREHRACCDNDSDFNKGGARDLSEGLVEMRSIPELNEALAESETRPVLFFKHSLTCPISSRAFNELQSYIDNAGAGLSYKLIVVQTARSVSNEIASKLRLEHETPQVILVRNGREVWSASHYEVTAAALKEAIGKID